MEDARMERAELALFFREGLFLPDMKARTKEEALEELVDLFVREHLVRNRGIVLEMLHKREALGSTGIGKGVAIPHGRTLAAPDIVIAFGRSRQGIDYDAMDGKPVHLFFLVLAPPQDQSNKYLPVLGKLVEMLSEDENCQKLMQVESFQEFIDVVVGEK
jgi:mannitol/fructose-specific phosphotransferase system IIA component (Ntr-type)